MELIDFIGVMGKMNVQIKVNRVWNNKTHMTVVDEGQNRYNCFDKSLFFPLQTLKTGMVISAEIEKSKDGKYLNLISFEPTNEVVLTPDVDLRETKSSDTVKSAPKEGRDNAYWDNRDKEIRRMSLLKTAVDLISANVQNGASASPEDAIAIARELEAFIIE
jgi:hypothetical protein